MKRKITFPSSSVSRHHGVIRSAFGLNLVLIVPSGIGRYCWFLNSSFIMDWFQILFQYPSSIHSNAITGNDFLSKAYTLHTAYSASQIPIYFSFAKFMSATWRIDPFSMQNPVLLSFSLFLGFLKVIVSSISITASSPSLPHMMINYWIVCLWVVHCSRFQAECVHGNHVGSDVHWQMEQMIIIILKLAPVWEIINLVSSH